MLYFFNRESNNIFFTTPAYVGEITKDGGKIQKSYYKSISIYFKRIKVSEDGCLFILVLEFGEGVDIY